MGMLRAGVGSISLLGKSGNEGKEHGLMLEHKRHIRDLIMKFN